MINLESVRWDEITATENKLKGSLPHGYGMTNRVFMHAYIHSFIHSIQHISMDCLLWTILHSFNKHLWHTVMDSFIKLVLYVPDCVGLSSGAHG